MNYEKLIGVRFETNQVRTDTPIETIEEAIELVARLRRIYNLEDILKSCHKSKSYENSYSAYVYHNPKGFETYTLWDLLHS